MGAAGSTQRRASQAGTAAPAGAPAPAGAAPPPEYATVRVIVPPGMAPGQTAAFTVAGRTLRAVIPPGAVAGSAFDARVPAPASRPGAAPRNPEMEELLTTQLSAVSAVRETLGAPASDLSDDAIIAALNAQHYDVEAAVAALLDRGWPRPTAPQAAEAKEAPPPGDFPAALNASAQRHVANSHLEQMDAAALAAATDGFSDARLLGRGGFGAVYRGRLAGLDVAVKRLDAASMQGAAEFANEVRFLARATHRNLILLLGYETEGPCLVYELARGGSVEERLACANDTYAPLTWSLRLGVAIDVARGLNFLHAWPEGAIVHGDVKTANVLLTEPPVVAKLCDFGLGRLMSDRASQMTTMNLKGSWGYICPEYARTGKVGPGSDVYSLGVVLLELMTGAAAFEPARSPPDLASYARSKGFDGAALLDARVRGDCGGSVADVFGRVVEQCLAEHRADRMATETLLASLFSIRDTARGGHSAAIAGPSGGSGGGGGHSFLARLNEAKSV